jgi:hypothetical protein
MYGGVAEKDKHSLLAVVPMRYPLWICEICGGAIYAVCAQNPRGTFIGGFP